MMRLVLFLAISLGYLSISKAQALQEWASLPPEVSVTNGPTNGMWFTSPTNFVIKALKVPDDSMNPWNPQSIAVLKFTGAGAQSFPSVNYTVLFLIQDTMTGDSIPCNIPIMAGDHIGIIGSRWDASSNVGQCSNAGVANYSTTINGISTPLFRLLANSPLNNQAPSNVWEPSPTSPITRMEMYYEGCELPNPDSVSVNQLTCFGDSTGSISTSVSGIYSNSIIEWSTGDSGITAISGLTAGTYGLTITSPSGCPFDTTVTITQPTEIVNSASFDEPTCFGAATGSIQTTTNGGTSPYQYSWNNGGTAMDLQNISGGTYSLTVTDQNGCTNSFEYTLNQPDELVVSFDNAELNACPDHTDGAFSISISGGFVPYTAVWDDPNSTIGTTVTNLPNGTYNVTVSDFYNCTTSANATITSLHPNPTVDLGPDQNLPVSGLLQLFAPSGFTSYLWSTGSTLNFIGVSSPGSYWLTATDENTCSGSDTINVLEAIPSGVNEMQDMGFSVYPNPTMNEVTIQFTASHTVKWIELIDGKGHVLVSQETTSELVHLDMSPFASGLYGIRINDGEHSNIKMVLKQ